MKEIIQMAADPSSSKGIMRRQGSPEGPGSRGFCHCSLNHGGRVLDQSPATAEVLEEIAVAVGGTMKIFVDGGIRRGVDVFKALAAMGADA